MKLSELSSREIIDITTGTRLGPMSKADLEFDEDTGQLHAIWIETGKKSLFSSGANTGMKILWSSVQAIGEDALLVKSEEKKFS